MRISISNIAWELHDETAVVSLLAKMGVDLIDIAPGKYFPDLERATAAEVDAVRALWQDRGFEIEGMQALLFGTTGLNMFDDGDGAMLRRLAAVCRLGGGLGAHALTFGSPRQRDRSGLDEMAVERIAIDFFRRVGDVAAGADVLFCLEPNPPVYNCNFMTTTEEAAAMVELVDHPAIRLQIDVGALMLNGEPVGQTIRRFAHLAGHVHASEPRLATLGSGDIHAEAAIALAETRPDLAVTIEMTTPPGEAVLEAVERAVALAQHTYGATPDAR